MVQSAAAAGPRGTQDMSFRCLHSGLRVWLSFDAPDTQALVGQCRALMLLLAEVLLEGLQLDQRHYECWLSCRCL